METSKSIDSLKENGTNEPKMYEDYKSFQGTTFEKNINSINHLLFGQGLKISDIPYIIKEENSDKNILAINRINIKSDKVDKTICYPKKCIHIVFYHENSIFYLTQNNILEIYKMEENKMVRYSIQHNKIKNKQIKKKNVECDNLNELLDEIKKIKENNSVLVNYEILFNILKNNLKLKLEKSKSSKKNETLTFEISLKDFKFSVEIKNYEDEVDGVGMIREKLKVKNGKISLKEGINSINEYMKLKEGKNPKANEYIDNSFKCPIIYKNFSDDTIP